MYCCIEWFQINKCFKRWKIWNECLYCDIIHNIQNSDFSHVTFVTSLEIFASSADGCFWPLGMNAGISMHIPRSFNTASESLNPLSTTNIPPSSTQFFISSVLECMEWLRIEESLFFVFWISKVRTKYIDDIACSWDNHHWFQKRSPLMHTERSPWEGVVSTFTFRLILILQAQR